MGKTAKANILASTFMLLQLLLAGVMSAFKSSIESDFPALIAPAGLIISNQLFSVFLPTLIFTAIALRGERVSFAEFMRFSPLSGRNILLIVGMSFFIQPLMSILSAVSLLFFSNNIAVVAETVGFEMSYMSMIGLLALVPAVFEELAFRGAILGAYREIDERRAILINGFFFGLIHLDGQQLLYAIALGAFFAFIVLRTGSIFAGIIAHFTINASQTTIIYFMMKMIDASGMLDETAAAQNASSSYVSAGALPSADTAALVFALLFFTMFFLIGAGVIFSRLLKRFIIANPHVDRENESCLNDEEFPNDEHDQNFSMANKARCHQELNPPELEKLRHALRAKKSFAASFYITFFAAVAIYIVFMLFNGCALPQILFLLGVFSAFFFVLFFLRIGS